MHMKQSVKSTGAQRIGAILATLVLALALLARIAAAQSTPPSASPQATPGVSDPVDAAVSWLAGQQLEDGSFAGLSGTPDVGATADALVALSAAHEDGAEVDLSAALAYLDANGGAYAAKGVGQAAKLVLAIVAAHGDPGNVAGVNPSDLITAATPEANGLYGTGVFDHAYVILVLAAAKEEVPPAAVAALAATQITDGSWGFDGAVTAGNGDTNTTALVVQALVAAGQGDNLMVAKALAYLKSTQTAGGSFPYQGGDAAIGDSNSTALAIQAIIAAGQDPASAEWGHAATTLEAFQKPDGAFYYQAGSEDDNFFSTVQALPAIAGYELPVVPTEGSAAAATPAV